MIQLLNKYRFTYIYVTFCLLLTIPTTGNAVDYSINENGIVEISNALVLIDDNKTINYTDLVNLDDQGKVSWKPVNRLNFGYVPYRVWVKFTFKNVGTSSNFILENQFPLIQKMQFALKTSKAVSYSWLGRERFFEQRHILHPHLLFPFQIESGETATLYLGYESAGPIMANPVIMTSNKQIEKTSHESLLYGIYIGIVVALAGYNLLLYLGTRERFYFWYSLYVFAYGLANATLCGFAFQYLWPNSLRWNHIAGFVTIAIYHLLLTVFTSVFLEVKSRSKSAYAFILVLFSVWTILAILPFFYYNYRVSGIVGWTMLISSFLLFIVAILCGFRGAKNVWYFITSFTGILIANMMYSGRAIGLIPNNAITTHGLEVASILEIFLLSRALVDRIKLIQAESAATKTKEQIHNGILHDLRNNLTGFQAAISKSKEPDPFVRVQFRTVYNAIQSLASRIQNQADSFIRPELVGILLSRAIDLAQYKLKIVESMIQVEMSKDASSIFCKIDGSEFVNIISNLINNSIEAKATKIHVSIFEEENCDLVIQLTDNGVGLSTDRLSEFNRGIFKSTKTDGSCHGFGLGTTFSHIKAWNGRLEFQAAELEGLSVSIKLPIESAPDWICQNIRIFQNTKVVVLDDDLPIHNIWKTKFGGIESKFNIDLLTATKVDEFKGIVSSLGPDAFALVDYHLIGESESGIDLIKSLNIRERAILVTSMWNDSRVIEESVEAGVRILPKELTEITPIQVIKVNDKELENLEWILIDDSKEVAFSWKSSAKMQGLVFDNMYEFIHVQNKISRNVKIYVDYNFRVDGAGSQISFYLTHVGFVNVWITTGENRNNLPAMPWVRGVTGKNPFWLADNRGWIIE